jgi:hypothetical protein
MLKIYHSNITPCRATHPGLLPSSENIFGKYYYFSFIVKESDTEKVSDLLNVMAGTKVGAETIIKPLVSRVHGSIELYSS